MKAGKPTPMNETGGTAPGGLRGTLATDVPARPRIPWMGADYHGYQLAKPKIICMVAGQWARNQGYRSPQREVT
jgi:hypothetical protein